MNKKSFPHEGEVISMNTSNTQNMILPMAEQYDGQQIRWTMNGDVPMFVLADICKVLDIKQPGSMARRLDDDEKGVLLKHTPGGVQEILAVTEPGLYSVLQICRKPKAKPFRRWLSHEVLPAIRREGKYELEQRNQLLDATFSWIPQPWRKSVPDKLWDELSRITGQPWNKENHQRPRNWAGLVNKFVYTRIPQDILDAMNYANPTDDSGRRKNRQFQHLQEESRGRFAQLVETVTNVLAISDNMQQAEMLLNHVVPVVRLTDTPSLQPPIFEMETRITVRTIH